MHNLMQMISDFRERLPMALKQWSSRHPSLVTDSPLCRRHIDPVFGSCKGPNLCVCNGKQCLRLLMHTNSQRERARERETDLNGFKTKQKRGKYRTVPAITYLYMNKSGGGGFVHRLQRLYLPVDNPIISSFNM